MPSGPFKQKRMARLGSGEPTEKAALTRHGPTLDLASHSADCFTGVERGAGAMSRELPDTVRPTPGAEPVRLVLRWERQGVSWGGKPETQQWAVSEMGASYYWIEGVGWSDGSSSIAMRELLRRMGLVNRTEPAGC